MPTPSTSASQKAVTARRRNGDTRRGYGKAGERSIVTAMRLRFALLVLVVASGRAVAAPAPPSAETERLVVLGKVWGTVNVFHPYLAYRDIDWDAALLAAIPKVLAAKS